MKTAVELLGHTDCQTEQATLLFLTGWRNIQQGSIHRGGKLVIEYDPERLPGCRVNYRGAEVWDIEVYIKFHPGGQFYSGSVLDKIRNPPEHGLVVKLVPKALEVVVPLDANEVELWFSNSYQVRGGCQAWDSRYGQNYWYQVVGR